MKFIQVQVIEYDQSSGTMTGEPQFSYGLEVPIKSLLDDDIDHAMATLTDKLKIEVKQ